MYVLCGLNYKVDCVRFGVLDKNSVYFLLCDFIPKKFIKNTKNHKNPNNLGNILENWIKSL